MDNNSPDVIENIVAELEADLEQNRRSLRELSLMLEQSQAELNKQNQRNAAITTHLQQVQSHLESTSKADIRMAYNSALDSQQRMLVMRGQIEKLQTEQVALQRYVTLLEKVFPQLALSTKEGKKRAGGGSAMLEMLIEAQEAERKRLSQLMHDGPAQALSNFIVQTEIAARYLDVERDDAKQKAREELSNLKTAAGKTFREVRSFIFEIRPMMLDDLGVADTLKRYVDSIGGQYGVETSVTIKGGEKRLRPYIEVMIFRAVQELIGNAIRHNQDNAGKIHVALQLVIDENSVRVVVSDNGKGFDVSEISGSGGLGLKLIRERVEILGGYFEIDSNIGKGTRITFQVPCLEA